MSLTMRREFPEKGNSVGSKKAGELLNALIFQLICTDNSFKV